nr:type II toxin-antitoxin system prevent-host-death family antitoxin [Frankia gtarii]
MIVEVEVEVEVGVEVEVEVRGAVPSPVDVRYPVRTTFCTGREGPVRTMTYSESRARYAEVLSAVTDDREEIIITRAGHEPVVIVSLEDYQSLKETAYLLRSPENARRLLTAIDRLESGGGVVRDLAE